MAARFPTARDVGEAFPLLLQSLKEPLTAEPPERFATKLIAAGKLKESLSFCAFLLGRRTAVEWAYQVVSALPSGRERGPDEPLRAALEWLENPTEQSRREANRVAEANDQSVATTWVARAAAWSGGNLAFSDHAMVHTPPDLAGQAARSAVVLGLNCVEPPRQDDYLRESIESALLLARRDDEAG